AALTGANQYQGDTTVGQNANLTLNGTVGAIKNSGTTAFTGKAGDVTNQSGTTTLSGSASSLNNQGTALAKLDG
ncbi:hypothetical protein, partial [Saccharibacter floricola]|uniref:hypothetical protein n=1 Tax=Saccharibacter floricola TaxID=231053 RepID=UPI002231D0E6